MAQTKDKPTGDLWTALASCNNGLRQVERVGESYAAFEATYHRSADAQGNADARWEKLRLHFLCGGDVHFLLTAAYHLNKALQGMPNGPSLPQPLDEQVEEQRHLVEHWEDAQVGDLGEGVWERSAIRHDSPYPAQLSLTPNGSDLMIGETVNALHAEDRTSGAPAYQFSLNELELVLRRVLDELRQMDTEEEAI